MAEPWFLKLPDGNYLYPLTVTYDRYTGSYSGGEFIAWNHYPHNIPEEIDGNDDDARNFWIDMEYNKNGIKDKYRFGVGHTIEEALERLYNDVVERGESSDWDE